VPCSVYLGAQVAGYPEVDAALFAPGGVLLADVVRAGARGFAALGAHAAVVVVLASVVGLVPMAALVTAMGYEHASPGAVAARSLRAFPTLVLLWGIALLAQIASLSLIVLIGNSIVTRAGSVPPREHIARALVTVFAVMVVLAIGVVHDLARVAAVDGERGLY